MSSEAAGVGALRRSVRGEVISPGDPGYNAARAVWNAMIDRRPVLIVRCRGAADVLTALRYAHQEDLPVAVRGGGHNVGGQRGVRRGLVIDVSPMKGVRVDPLRRRARAGPGVTWGEFDHESQAFALATPGGIVYALHPVGPIVWGGLVFYDFAEAAPILRSLRDAVHEAPNELFPVAVLRVAPPTPYLPAEVRGCLVIAICCCHIGPLERAEHDLAPFRAAGPPLADLVRPRPYCELQSMLDARQAPGFRNYWRAEYLEALSDAAIETNIDYATTITSPLSDIKVIPGGGALGDPRLADSAFQGPEGPVLVNINPRWSDPAEAELHVGWTKQFWSALRPWSTGAGYVNFMGDEGPDRVQAAYGQDRWGRLVALKKTFDPTNVFRFNHNIDPSPARLT